MCEREFVDEIEDVAAVEQLADRCEPGGSDHRPGSLSS
jgi:hypothetical protein